MAYKANPWKKFWRKVRVVVKGLFLTAKKERSVFSQGVGKLMQTSASSIVTMTTL